MQTARVNYVGSSDVEYTEIRPIRPNQSVVLAGLGVTGNKVGAWRKDRGYRSTQGAGYSDGLVIHSRPNTQDDWNQSRQQNSKAGVTSSKKVGGRHPSSYQRYQGEQFSRNSTSFTQYADMDRKYSMLTNYDPKETRSVLFEMPPIPSSSPPYRAGTSPPTDYRIGSVTQSESYLLSPSPVLSYPTNGGKSTAGTYDMFFEQHLQNIVNIEEDPASPALSASPGTGKTTDRSTPGTGPRYREASSQTPTDLNLRISPLIPSRLTNNNQDNITRIVEEGSQTCDDADDKEDACKDRASYRDSENVSDDELSMIGDFMVKESLDEATAIYDDPMQDFTDLQGDLSASDLRADEFSALDYYRAGLSPPHTLPSKYDMIGDDLKVTPRNQVKFTPREGETGPDAVFESMHMNSPRIKSLIPVPERSTAEKTQNTEQ